MAKYPFLSLISRLVTRAFLITALFTGFTLAVARLGEWKVITYIASTPSSSKIYAADMVSQLRVKLGNQNGNVVTFAFSPDGQQIIYTTNHFQPSGLFGVQIYIRDVFGRQQRLLADFTGSVTSPPSWSPDGTQVTYSANVSPAVANGAPGGSDIFVLNVQNGAQTQLTANAGRNVKPAWSSDGQHILFSSSADGTIGYRLHRFDLSGKALQKLMPDVLMDNQVAWSPDGQRMAFVRISANEDAIYVGDSDGSNLRALTEFPIGDSAPVWSPDGTQIAFQRFVAGQNAIYVIHPDGSNLYRVVNGAFAISGSAAWSTDSCCIAYAADMVGRRDYVIMIVNAVDGGEQVLTPLSDDSRSPVWWPK